MNSTMQAGRGTVSLSVRVPPAQTLVVACFGAFLAFLDATIVNVAFPSMRESFAGASIESLSWILNSYNIVFAAFLIVFGRLGDLVGRRRVFIAGVALFTIASVLCGVATSVPLLVVCRVLQALGAALLVPASLAVVIAAFPGERRAHAIGVWGASAAVAAGLGPPSGGALVQAGGWRWAFLVNLPFGLAAYLSARKLLVESRAPGRRTLPDLPGAVLLAVAMAAINLGIVKGGDWGWGSPAVIGAFAATAISTALFVASSRRHPSPMLDPALMRLRSFTVGSIATVIAGFGFYSYLLTNILWLQYIWHYDVLQAGLALVPGAVVAAVVAGRLGPVADAHGYRRFVVPGALVWAAAYAWYHERVGLTADFWGEWLPGQILSGIGVGLTLPLLASAALASVPGGRYATASAVVSSARQLGGVLGVAILVIILGEPTAATIVGALRDGWLLAIVAFVGVAVVALALTPSGKVTEDDPARYPPPRVRPPEPPASWAPPPVIDGAPRPLARLEAMAALPDAARQQLEAAMRVVHVPAGHALIEQGDPPGAAYGLRSGRLEVLVDGRVVRELGPGEVIGEIALITGEPRSATVRARRDASVVELPREAFDDLMNTDVAATKAVMTQLAERLRTAGGPAGAPPPQRPTVISVVGLGPGAPTEAVAETLRAGLARYLSVVDPGRVDPEGLERAEGAHDRVVLVAADDTDRDWHDFVVRQGDTVVLVGRTDQRPTDRDPREPNRPRPSRQPEVVLVGPAPTPKDRAAWAAATDAWALTLVPDVNSLSAGLRPLANRLAGRSIGLVLAGGGARALSHIGIINELEDAGLQIDRVAGTSMGAILAGAYAVGMNGAELEATAYGGMVRRQPFSDWRLPTTSLARGRRTEAMLQEALGADEVIEGLPRQLRVASVDLVSRTRVIHARGNLVHALLASSRLPAIFAPIPQDDGRLLIDGGILDNLPTDVWTQRDEGPVLAVHIGTGSERRRTGPPPVPALGETLVRIMTIGSGGASQAAQRLGAWVIEPSTLGVGLLEFHQMDLLVEAGRAAARALLEQTGGDLGLLGQPGPSA